MGWFKDDSSLFWSEEQSFLSENNLLDWNEPIEPDDFGEIKEEKGKEEEVETKYFEKKNEGNNTGVSVKPEVIEHSTLIRDYENWEGRVIFTDEDIIRARIINTQRIYSPRIMQISRSVFASKGISKDLSVGDMFEITFKHVKIEFKTKEEKLRQREENFDTIRLIEQVCLTRSEIDKLVSKELQALSYLFE